MNPMVTLEWTAMGLRDTKAGIMVTNDDDIDYSMVNGNTYVFKPVYYSDLKCSLHLVHSSKGEIINNHFISTKDKLHIPITNETHRCNVWARATSYDGIFITRSWLSATLPPATERDVNLWTLIYASNDYFHWRTAETLRTRICLQWTEVDTDDTSKTWELDGAFTMLRGDSIIAFQFPPIIVTALPPALNGSCYNELVVNVNNSISFVSPSHHILMSVPVLTPCSENYSLKY